MPVHRLNGCRHRRLSWQKRGWLRKNYLKMYCLSEPETKKNVAFRDAIYCDPARLGTGENFNSGHFTPDLWINVFGWCVGSGRNRMLLLLPVGVHWRLP